MLNLPDRFKLDVVDSGYNFTSLYPIVKIDEIDQIIASFQEDKPDGVNQKDCDLRISNIRESIDINNRNFKTGNVNITFRNPNFEGDISFTDFIIDKDIINSSVEIYYTSPGYSIEDSLLVYKGTIKSFNHDSSKVKMVIEDQTLDKLDKKVPYANTSFTNKVYKNRDQNVPIPMVYGDVDKAPALVMTDLSNIISETKDYIISDDVLNDDRGITLNSFGGGDEVNDGTNASLRPLYIYNGDYYNVLANFNNDIIGEVEDVADWQWQNTTQYEIVGNKIEVPRIYHGVFPLNPPSFNEMQCIKLRSPSYLVNMGNPATGYSVDTQNHQVYNIDTSIVSPELAVDSNDFQNDIYSNPAQEQDIYNTFAQIPDPNSEPEITPDGYSMIDVFIPHREAAHVHGVHNRTETGAFEASSYQYEVQSWLTRNMNYFNTDLSDPHLVYIAMPTYKMIEVAVVEKMRAIAAEEYPEENTNGWSVIKTDSFPYESETRVGSYVNICPSYIQDWGSKITTVGGDNASEYWSEADISGSIMSNPIDFLSGYGGFDTFDSYQFTAIREGSTWATNPDFENGVPYPQATYYRFVLHENHRKPIGVDEQGLGASFICVSQLNDSMSVNHWDDVTGNDGTLPDEDPVPGAFYFNIFDDGSDVPYLFNPEDFAQYIPTDIVWKGHINEYKRMCRIMYRAAWNGVSPTDSIDEEGDFNLVWDRRYFGAWHRHDNDVRVYENDVYTHANKAWAIWVKKEMPSVGGGLGQLNDNSDNNPTITDFYPEGTIEANHKLRIPANTIIPCKHRANKWEAQSIEWTGEQFVIGNTTFEDSDNIIIHDGNELGEEGDADVVVLDKRLNLAFPLRELDIENEVKTDSFFQGKFELFFSNDTADVSNAKFIAAVGAVDTQVGETEGETFNWATLDQNRKELINKQLNQCIIDSEVLFSTAPGDAGVYNNAYTQNISDLRISQFHTTDNYNALNLTFRVEHSSPSGEMGEDAAVFNMKMYHASILHYIQFEKALESDFYLHTIGRSSDGNDEINQILYNDVSINKYTGEEIGDSDDQTSGTTLEKPTDVIFHILEKEVNIIDNMDYDSITKARGGLISTKLAFSVNEEIDVKNLFQEISKSSNIIPKFNNNSNFGFVALKEDYGIEDIDMVIRNKDIISYAFSRTPISEINTIVNVKYKYDYAEDKYIMNTGYIDGYDCFGNGDHNARTLFGYSGYSYDSLGIDREDKVLEFESKYIRDKDSAKALRDFLYLWHCNQHTKFDLRLPLKYCMLEVGDIIGFDELIDNHKAYGEDYSLKNTELIKRNQQTIYPLFLIESISKKEKDIQIKVIQLHSLTKTFQAVMGSVARLAGDGEDIFFPYTYADVLALDDFLLGYEKYFTSEQKRVSDLVAPFGYIDEHDLEHLEGLQIPEFGDFNQDNIVNIVDVVALVNQILGSNEYDEVFDVNQDGIISVLDLVALVNIIIN